MPHLKDKRPDKGKLTQAKKVIASGMTEAEAIDRAKGGDAEAFEGLYGLHKRRVYSLCLRMTGNTAEAEDLTQEAFLQLYRKIATFRGESAFSTWLHRLAVNVVLNARKSEGRERSRTVDGEDEDGEWTGGSTGAPLHAERLDLESAIATLPPGARKVFVLHDVEGYKHEEIAEMLGITSGGSKAQLHRARLLLREALTR
jgi:RNA polymerase sigma-70 factor (ECF subfamily)